MLGCVLFSPFCSFERLVRSVLCFIVFLRKRSEDTKQTLVRGGSPHFPRWSNGTLVCEAEIRETSCRPVRSEDETLAGAPLWSLMLTFLSRSAREIALGEVLPACWMREAGVEATGSAELRSRLAVAPVGGPGGRALVADPRNCPILSSRSCSRRSRSTSSGFLAAPNLSMFQSKT